MSEPPEAGEPLNECKPRDPRAKDTITARRIERFRRRIDAQSLEEACVRDMVDTDAQGVREVRMRDMVDYLGYKGPTILQRVSRHANASQTAIEAVERMLRSSSKEFWSVVDDHRKSKAKLK
jgi:hypothetical protein